ncbi:MAG: hypothetical protein ABSF97_01040 [Candidatus Sulfotelmatobacter sp.]|jgi:hypothetical protein
MANRRIMPGEKRDGKPFAIYGLICPITLEVKYVGQSTDVDRRFYQHTGANSHEAEVRQWMESLGGYLRPHRVILERGVNRVVRLKSYAVRKEGKPGPAPSGFTDVWLSSCLELKWIKRHRRTVLNRRVKPLKAIEDALSNQTPLPWELDEKE